MGWDALLVSIQELLASDTALWGAPRLMAYLATAG